MLAAAITSHQLKPAPARIADRLLRESVAHVARTRGIDRMDVEDAFRNARNAFAHLMAHDRWRLRIEDQIDKLMRSHTALITSPGVEKFFGDLEIEKLRRGIASLDKVRAAVSEPKNDTQRQLLDSVDFMLDEVRKAINAHGAADQIGAAKVRRLESAAADIAKSKAEILEQMGVTHEHVNQFVEIVADLRLRYAREQWSFDDFASEPMLRLAQMIAVNFTTYDKTLNT